MWHTFMSVHAIQSTLQVWYYDYSLLTKIYVSVNAFRSLFPVKVLESECLTLVSSPFIDRSLATIAELCFAQQLSTSLQDRNYIVHYALLAQLCCWTAMITHNNLFHVYEEYLWFLIGYHYYWYSTMSIQHYIAFVYCFYMFFVDIPMYFYRFVNDEMINVSMFECTQSSDWSDEYLWRIGYFIGASRISMYLN
jgi:hypothetical protein